MSDFKAKMHKIRFQLGLRPRPRWESLQRSTDPLAVFKGPSSKERAGKGWRGGKDEGKGRGEGSEGRGRKRGGTATPSTKYFGLEPPLGNNSVTRNVRRRRRSNKTEAVHQPASR